MSVPVEFNGVAMMRLNPEFLIDFLSVLDADAIVCWYIPDGKEANPTMLCLEKSTAKLNVTNAAKESYVYVIMPQEVDSPIIPEAEAERARWRKKKEEEEAKDESEEEKEELGGDGDDERCSDDCKEESEEEAA
jgi:hypothetical protein